LGNISSSSSQRTDICKKKVWYYLIH
jgi:hypothetical protein